MIPLYYQRDRDGLPRGWIKRMKRTIRTLGWRFSADRMVMDYTRNCYVPAAGGTSSEMKSPCLALVIVFHEKRTIYNRFSAHPNRFSRKILLQTKISRHEIGFQQDGFP